MTEKAATYEEKVAQLEQILERLDDSRTPIDELAQDVKLGAGLIVELDARLREVEAEVKDAFAELADA